MPWPSATSPAPAALPLACGALAPLIFSYKQAIQGLGTWCSLYLEFPHSDNHMVCAQMSSPILLLHSTNYYQTLYICFLASKFHQGMGFAYLVLCFVLRA